jgi:hypothetical protein
MIVGVSDEDFSMRCGKVICRPVRDGGPTHYKLLDVSGTEFKATTDEHSVTCKKCINLMTVGTIHDKRQSGTAITEERRTVATARRGPRYRLSGRPAPAR